MMLRVETRKISARDWMWMVRIWEGGTVDSGHTKSKSEALRDGRAAKKAILKELAARAKENGHGAVQRAKRNHNLECARRLRIAQSKIRLCSKAHS